MPRSGNVVDVVGVVASVGAVSTPLTVRSTVADFSPAGDAARVVRGGSWNNDHHNARASYRNRNHPNKRNNNQGFRLVISSHTSVPLLRRGPPSPQGRGPLRAQPAGAARGRYGWDSGVVRRPRLADPGEGQSRRRRVPSARRLPTGAAVGHIANRGASWAQALRRLTLCRSDRFWLP